MRVLLLTHSFNSLTQRLYVELMAQGHELSVEFDINDEVTGEAVTLWRPDLVIAPFLKRRIAESVWRDHTCLIVHPGIPGDRGPAALDWAILEGESTWGVTVLQAQEQLDAGPVWAWRAFPMRPARKSSLYRNEVTEAAVAAVMEAVQQCEADVRPATVNPPGIAVSRPLRPAVDPVLRRIDWQADDTATVLRKIRSADGSPGVEDEIFGMRVRLFDAHAEGQLTGPPGDIIGRRDDAVCRATIDGAVWIGHLKPVVAGCSTFKLPAVRVLGTPARSLPTNDLAIDTAVPWPTFREIHYVEEDYAGYLYFDFYNGAMSTEQCERLRTAYAFARSRPTRVLVLMGGHDFWSNGLNLNTIEAAASPADESWRNINAMDDLARDIIRTGDKLVISVLRGNAGAGGVFLALAADYVCARHGVVLNPHYKNMGNLYGSEYWTYLLPHRTDDDVGRELMQRRLPLSAIEALQFGLIDECLPAQADGLVARVREVALALAGDKAFDQRTALKKIRREQDETHKPLDRYRTEELERMKLNFYGFDPSYHVARYKFVHRVPHAWTPRYLAVHRRRNPALSPKAVSQRASAIS